MSENSIIFNKVSELKQTVIAFGLLAFSVLVLFQLAQFTSLRSGWTTELWIALFSAIFLFIGIFLNKKLQKEKIVEKEVVVEKAVYRDKTDFKPDTKNLDALKISKREFEVLQLITKGLSNQQIADSLFLSEHTVKKHVTSLFFKLDVERRTEAIVKARELNLVN